MMIRTGHKPEDWRDEGPSYARARALAYERTKRYRQRQKESA